MKITNGILVLEEEDLVALFNGVLLEVPERIDKVMLRVFVLDDFKLVRK